MTDVQRPRVEDFATDFDHTDPAWVKDPFPIWEDLRGRCPVAHSDRYGGTWLPVNHDDVTAIAYDTEHFTSRAVVVSNTRPGPDDLPAPIGGAPPITSDPPFHAGARRLLLPAFSPKQIDPLEPFTRQCCRELLDGIGDADVVDAAEQYAQHIPVRVIAKMLGFPLEDADYFRWIIHEILEGIGKTQDEVDVIGPEIDAYFDKQIADHLENPRDDLTSYLLNVELDGQKLPHEVVRGVTVLLLVAGIDTTWSAIGAALFHLAQAPEDRRRLVAEESLMPRAIEELLRAYAPVTMARLVAKDVTIGDAEMKEGDWVLLPFPAANRDPAKFDRADEVVIDREVNRHSAFGLGIHRCIGSNLARMEIRVAVEEWLRRFPEFSLADPDAVTWAAGQVRGPRTLPVRIGPST
jgi:cytochrome P450